MQTVNTFSKGMNSDTDKSILSKDQYLYAENFRIFTESGNTTGALENITGNTQLVTTGVIPSGYTVCGYVTIRNELYIFITNNTSATPSGGNSRIIKILFDSTGTSISSTSVIYNDANSTDGSTLNLSSVNKIKAVGRYESDTIKKIYFVDGYNNIRFANVAIDISTQPANKFDIIPNFSISAPSFTSFVSGSLTSGKVQYAYQMYDLNGGETLFSPASNLVSVSVTSGQSGSNKTFKGSDKDVNTGKGVRFSITHPSGFNRIRVVSIKYDSINATPSINIVADRSVSTSSSTIYFIDSGADYLGTYTLEEFAIVGNSIFTAKEIETKNDYLFTANISKSDWDVDFDARAYRFLAYDHPVPGYERMCYLRDMSFNDPSPLIIDGAADPSTWNVPETHGCINNFNEIIDYYSAYQFKYQADGSTLGGEGLNVKYSFVYNDIIISSVSDAFEEYSYDTDYSNASVESTYVGYQRDEVYRFGIVFFDEKGRNSSVKWIGDVRMPQINESGYETFYWVVGNPGVIHARVLGLSFTVDTSSVISQGAKYFKVVRAKRESGDRSILAQGLAGACITGNTASGGATFYCTAADSPLYATTYVADGTTNRAKNVLELLSPEINFNKNLGYVSGDIIEIPAYYDTVNSSTQGSAFGAKVTKCYNVSGLLSNTKYKSVVSTNIVPFTNEKVQHGTVLLNAYNKYSVDIQGSYKYLNIYKNNNPTNPVIGFGGTKGIVNMQSSFDSDAAILNKRLLFNYRRRVNSTQYGGLTYQARINTPYIACGPITTCATSSDVSVVYGGDTYLAMYDYLRDIIVQDSVNAIQSIQYFPVETSINLRFRQDPCYSKLSGTYLTKLLLNEYAGSYIPTWSGASTTTSLTQTTDLYKYNSVYSQENSTVSYFQKSDLVTSDTHTYDTRVLVSDVKINGEVVDSWTKFKMDNFLDVDSTYGEITTLKNYKNSLYFWQPNGYGILSVNTRSLTQDTTNAQLVLGTSGILDRYDYISNVSGCSYRFSVVAGMNGLYWFDANNKTFYRYSGNEEALSKVKGINTLLKESTTNTLPNSISAFDKKNNEILFTAYINSAIKVVSFNELLDSFNGIYTYTPSLFIETDNTNYISSVTNQLWIHNIGNKGSFYGTVSPSKLTFLVNDNYQTTKVFDMFEYHSTSNITSTNYLTNTFSSIRVYNDYQNSDYETITINSNLIRKERGFKLMVPRNAVDPTVISESSYDIFDGTNNIDQTKSFRERMRDKYLITDLVYTNTSTRNFSIPYIITNYRVSNR